MAKFIKLTGSDGTPLRLNVEHIMEYFPDPENEGGSVISCNFLYETRPNDDGGTDHFYQELQVAETPGYLDEVLGTIDSGVSD